MFDDIRHESTHPANKKRRGRIIYILGAAAALLTITAIVLAYKVFTAPSYAIPSHIVGQVPYPIFVPKRLPNDYKIVEKSFAIGEGTLLFRAEDSSGSSIAFTEQKRPQDFDFERFYQEQMQNAKKLNGTPYPSVLGKTLAGDRFLLSIATNETWVMLSTAAPLNEQDFTTIAKNIKKH